MEPFLNFHPITNIAKVDLKGEMIKQSKLPIQPNISEGKAFFLK